MRLFDPWRCTRIRLLFEDHEGRESRSNRGGGELRLHPEGLEVPLRLPCGQPQLVRFLVLLSGDKSLALDAQNKQALELLNGGRAFAPFPLPNGLPGEAKEPTQFLLAQAHALAQFRTRAPKGILPLLRSGMRLIHLTPPGVLCAPFTMARTCSRSRTSSCRCLLADLKSASRFRSG